MAEKIKFSCKKMKFMPLKEKMRHFMRSSFMKRLYMKKIKCGMVAFCEDVVDKTKDIR